MPKKPRSARRKKGGGGGGGVGGDIDDGGVDVGDVDVVSALLMRLYSRCIRLAISVLRAYLHDLLRLIILIHGASADVDHGAENHVK